MLSSLEDLTEEGFWTLKQENAFLPSAFLRSVVQFFQYALFAVSLLKNNSQCNKYFFFLTFFIDVSKTDSA